MKRFLYYYKYLSKAFFKEFNLLLKEIVYYLFLGKLFKIKKDLKIKIKGNTIVIPNFHDAFVALNEVFTWELYNKLKGCKKVLDLGGFLGESGIYLELYNSKVDIYKPNAINFSYITKNIKSKPNIKAYNFAVITNEK